jgi:hypothetical protein
MQFTSHGKGSLLIAENGVHHCLVKRSEGVRGKAFWLPPFRPIKRELRKLILQRVAGFVKYFIFSLKELQALVQPDNAVLNGLRPPVTASILRPPMNG